jgi:hypothetical protein
LRFANNASKCLPLVNGSYRVDLSGVTASGRKFIRPSLFDQDFGVGVVIKTPVKFCIIVVQAQKSRLTQLAVFAEKVIRLLGDEALWSASINLRTFTH